ncbi:MAG: ornithine cyclodeaminase family protein [Hyphomicrobiales bacterium]|nr:ornithine cyclodeaminase family protein [Hyphomicrobiales bacterium]
MRIVRDAEVRAVADPVMAVEAIREAFIARAAGRTALQPRRRISIGDAKLSTMAAILADAGIAGAKVYTTVGGQFRFVVLLFDATDGSPLACIEADTFTEIRTAAVTEAAAVVLGPPNPSKLAVFGTGVQARAHANAFARRFPLRTINVVSRGDATLFCNALSVPDGCSVSQTGADAAVDDADFVVTATRAREPLFGGALLAPGTFVAAVGSTLPDKREIDNTTFQRATAIIVEDHDQSFAEAGGLILAEQDGALDRRKVQDLAEALADPDRARPDAEAIVVFESVGIALEDVALAAAIWRALSG